MMLRLPFLQLNVSLKIAQLQSSLSSPAFIIMLFSPSFRTSLLLTSRVGLMQTDNDTSRHKINLLNPFILIIILLFPICSLLYLEDSYNQMGGKQSAISEEQLEFMDCRHPTISRVRVSSTSDGKIMETEFWIGSVKEIAQWIEIKFTATIKSLSPAETPLWIRRHLQSTISVNQITYPFYPYLLSDYITTSDHLDRLYENEKIWNLILNLTDAVSIFHSRGRKLGDIRPINIFLNNFQKVKLAIPNNQLLEDYFRQINYILGYQNSYKAPQQMKQLSFGNNQPKINLQKAESFSVGLTLIDRILFCSSEDLYNLSAARFEYKKLQQKHERVRLLQGINPLLKAIIILLSHADEQKRISCRQVYEWLGNYRQDIIANNQPKIDQVPDFLQAEGPFSSYAPSQNLYIESQVVAEFPAKFQHSNALPNGHIAIPVSHPLQQFKRTPFALVNTTVESTDHIGNRLNARPVESIAVENVKLRNSSGQDDFSLTLKRIEEQLQRSRKLFPS